MYFILLLDLVPPCVDTNFLGLLNKLIKGKGQVDNQTILVQPTHVVTRQSTNILAIEDEVVAKALRFIRENVKSQIQVRDVTEEVALSRQVLNPRFQKALGTSISDQIRKTRIEFISEMLVETNLSVSEIALNMGMSFDHISRYFKKQKGMSLLAYRKKYS